MKLLSNEVIMKYDYAKSKMNVEGFIRDFEEDYYKYVNLLPPSISSHLCEIKTQSSRNMTSDIEMYVIRKEKLENVFKENLDTILKVTDNFSMEEQRYFKGRYFLGNSDDVLFEELRCGETHFEHIKRSSILKFALALNLAIPKSKTP